jgi:hypothetical protein
MLSTAENYRRGKCGWGESIEVTRTGAGVQGTF